MNAVSVSRGDGPLILAFPHAGTFVPDDIAADLNSTGRRLADTDWHVDRLYAGLVDDVTAVQAHFHRYVVDANRDPGGGSLYPGQSTTALVPMTDFGGEPIWTSAPDTAASAARCRDWHTPYHNALTAEIARVKALHGVAVVYDCHSIRSQLPYLFDGTLPDLNLGTDNGRTCAPELEAAVARLCADADGYSSVVNGRFRGGYTTRHYGQPDNGVHALQMELTQRTYLADEAADWTYDPSLAEPLRGHLARILTTLVSLAATLERHR